MPQECIFFFPDVNIMQCKEVLADLILNSYYQSAIPSISNFEQTHLKNSCSQELICYIPTDNCYSSSLIQSLAPAVTLLERSPSVTLCQWPVTQLSALKLAP